MQLYVEFRINEPTFNSLSRDHSSTARNMQTDTARNAFNSLSRDHVIVTSIDESEEQTKLSTPSLGITRDTKVVLTLKAGEATFNSLSRDHSYHLPLLYSLVTDGSFNSLSRDHSRADGPKAGG